MEMHGFDDPTADVHTMYSPDPPTPGSDADTIDHGHDPGTDPDSDSGGPGVTGVSGVTGTRAFPELIELDVNGRVSEVGATIDTDHDGRADTAIIGSGDGNHVAITDSDDDGMADRALLIDDRGQVVDSATFDHSTGRWHDGGAQTASPDATGSQAAAGAGTPGTTGTTAQIEVNADGQQARVAATIDTDHDGRADTAIIDGGDSGVVAVTDTNADGRADEAALIDSGGHVAVTAHVDPHTGQWVRGDDGNSPYAVGESVPEAGGSVTAGTGTSSGIGTTTGADPMGTATGTTDASPDRDADTTTSTASEGPSHGRAQPITVDAGGRTSTVGATEDADHDGVNETAVVRGVDGTRVTFSDTDGDGEADRATVIDPRGNVLGTARYDPATGEWSDDPRG